MALPRPAVSRAMTQLFHPATNTLSRVSIFSAVFFLAAATWVWGNLLRSPYATQQNVVRQQPVEFSHEHHVSGLGIDCRYCHTSVEESAFAGVPATKTCMTCHSMVWKDADMLEPVRDSWRTDLPIEWTRVHDLPDFVYFDHAVHLAGGIGCSSCHGPVDRMPLTWQAAPLTMEWCLDCHRDPQPFLRPKAELYDTNWAPDAPHELSREPRSARALTDCSTCHR